MFKNYGMVASMSKKEVEWKGSRWKHPYFIYLVLTLALFGFLLTMGYLASTFDWLPKR